MKIGLLGILLLLGAITQLEAQPLYSGPGGKPIIRYDTRTKKYYLYKEGIAPRYYNSWGSGYFYTPKYYYKTPYSFYYYYQPKNYYSNIHKDYVDFYNR